VILVSSIVVSHVGAQETELEDCLGPNTRACSDSERFLVEDSCGAASYRFIGRVAWPPLKNVGPVTISVRTRAVSQVHTVFPLYFEIRGLHTFSDSTECRTRLAGVLLMEVQGGSDCGGTWTTIGPLDLRPFSVTLGEFYHLQCLFLETIVDMFGFRFYSPGLSCIRITSEPSPVVESTWTKAKILFQ
jgi:hypothetical protein